MQYRYPTPVLVALLTFLALPSAVYAQQGGGGGGATSSGTSIVNVSEQGGFIGSGRPAAFVGVHDVANRSSSTSRTTSAARPTTTTRPRTSVTSSASARMSGGMTGMGQLGSTNNQTIRSATALGFDRTTLIMDHPMQRPAPVIETNLARMQGMQNSQVSFVDSPTGTTAVLTGTVSSESERRVAQILLLMEPGIYRVDNQLNVQ